MKKIKLILIVVMVGLLVASCKRDITEPVISSDPSAPVQSDLSLTVDFNKANAESPITFSWSAADFGFESSTTYTLQLSPNSNFSGDVKDLATTQELTYSSTVKQIDNILLGWGLADGTQTTVYYRVAASVTTTNVVYSAVKSKNLTPFKFQLDPDQYTVYYVPGSYQGWSPGADNGRIYSYNADSKFEGIVRLVDTSATSAQFKITSAPNWDNNWGGSLTKSGTDYSGTLVSGGDNLVVDNGCYSFLVDMTALTISLTKTNDWGLIGDATPDGWNSDQNMFYDGKYKVWTITLDLVAGTVKFRANDDWGLNYGDGKASEGVAPNGTLYQDGDNIPISEAGNYTITLDIENNTYTVTKN